VTAQSIERLKKGTVVSSGIFPERVEVITAEGTADGCTILARGLETGKIYEKILGREQIGDLAVSAAEGLDFHADGREFFLGVEANRIRLAFEFDPLFALNASRVDPVPHQLEAVYKYLLSSHRAVRYLLADDPGAGKTIMAGLVLKELKMRALIDSCLVVVPGHLKYQWLREMKEKFGETFTLVDRGTIDSSYGTNVWKDRRWCITSLDFIRQDEIKETLRNARWDLVMIDEAHKMSAYLYGEKTHKTKRYQIGELLAQNSTNLLCLTATPHRGDPDNFRLLLSLLDGNVFATREGMERVLREDREQFVLRRMKEELKGFDGKKIFPPREVTTVGYELSKPEMDLYDQVTKYVKKYYSRAQRMDDRRRRNITLALVVLQRRAASSTRAIRTSLDNRRKRLQDMLDNHRLLQEMEAIYGDVEERLEDMAEEERWKVESALESLTTAASFEELQEEIDELKKLIEETKKVERAEVETKLRSLKGLLDHRVKKGKEDEKLLVFTEAKATLDYLADKIKSWGYSVCVIHGNMNLEARIKAEEEFKHTAQVMVATEAAGEGVNLQFCWMMVNYDIPWNPNRLEQRMGRIHRYGQKHPIVFIFNLVAVNTREGKVLKKLFDKIETMKEHLGPEKVYDVIGDILENAKAEDLLRRVALGEQEVAEAVEIIDAISVEQTKREISRLTGEALAVKVDERWSREQARLSEENKLIPEYLENFFVRALDAIAGKGKVQKRDDGFLSIKWVPAEIKDVPYEFRMRYGLVDDRYPRFTFDKHLLAAEETADFVAPGHPLMESVVEKVLKKYGPELRSGAVFEDPDGDLNGLIWFLEGSVTDGTGDPVGKRMFAVYVPFDGGIRTIRPAVLWDLKPTEKHAPQPIADLASRRPDAVAHLVSNEFQQYREMLLAQRRRELAIKKKYGLAALESRILDLDTRMTEYLEKGGNEDDLAYQNWDRDMEHLKHEKQKMEERLAREANLTLTPPRIVGVAAVVPATGEGRISRDPEIEAIGMKVAMEYERKHGRTPRDVSGQNLGYDIVSEGGGLPRAETSASSVEPSSGEVRYIEVKARAGEGQIFLTPNEWMTARQLGGKAWLYVVADAATHPRLYPIQDPAAKLTPSQEVKIVRYVVERDEWKRVAS
jgi:superfamily II DNA or RNA helicase